MANPLGQAIDIERAERETLRWVLLTALWRARIHEMLLMIVKETRHG